MITHSHMRACLRHFTTLSLCTCDSPPPTELLWLSTTHRFVRETPWQTLTPVLDKWESSATPWSICPSICRLSWRLVVGMLYPRRLEGESCAGLIPSPPGLGWDGDWENNKTKTPIIVPPGEQSAVNMLNSTPQEAISVPNLHTCPQSGHAHLWCKCDTYSATISGRRMATPILLPITTASRTPSLSQKCQSLLDSSLHDLHSVFLSVAVANHGCGILVVAVSTVRTLQLLFKHCICLVQHFWGSQVDGHD